MGGSGRAKLIPFSVGQLAAKQRTVACDPPLPPVACNR